MHYHTKDDDKINFQKLRLISPIFWNIQRMQEVPFDEVQLVDTLSSAKEPYFQDLPPIREYLQHLVVFNENELWRASKEAEP